MRKTLLAATAVAMTVSGCSGPRLVGREDLTVVPAAELPPPSTDVVTTQLGNAVIGPLDQVSVEVFGVPELSRTVQVDASGRISLPLTGMIQAGGLTPQQVADIVQSRLTGQYVRNPRVSVNLVNPVSQTVTVDGAVNDPGIYPVTGRMTLMRAIARAKGPTEFASTNHVVVFRRVGEQDMAALYDLRAIRQGIYRDPQIYSNDVITVGESQARRIFRDVLQASGIITAPIITLLQRN